MKYVSRKEISFVVAGSAHGMIGSVLPMLGRRGVQLAFVGLPRIATFSVRSSKKKRNRVDSDVIGSSPE